MTADPNFLIDGICGANMQSSDGATQRFSLGATLKGSNDSEWTYVLAGAAVRQYAQCTLDQAYNLIEATQANAALGLKAAFPQFAFASGDYGWVPLKGINLKTLAVASILPNVALYSSASTGNVSTTSTGNTKLTGVVLTATAGTATTGNTVNILCSYPHFAI